MRFWRRLHPAPAPERPRADALIDAFLASLNHEVMFLRAQLEAKDKESAALRQEVIVLADRRLLAELEYLRRAAPAPAEPAATPPHPRGNSEVGASINHLYGMGALEAEEPTNDDEGLSEDDLADQKVEREAMQRERDALGARRG